MVLALGLGSFHVVLSLQVHRSQELRFGNILLDFRECTETLECPGKRWAAGVEPSWRNSARAVQKGNVGSRAPTESPLGHCLMEL